MTDEPTKPKGFSVLAHQRALEVAIMDGCNSAPLGSCACLRTGGISPSCMVFAEQTTATIEKFLEESGAGEVVEAALDFKRATSDLGESLSSKDDGMIRNHVTENLRASARVLTAVANMAKDVDHAPG